MTTSSVTGELDLGHILAATGVDLSDIVILRHTYTDAGLRPGELTESAVLDYTRVQPFNNKLGANPPRHWLVFMADGSRRSRLLVAYENWGEASGHATESRRVFDLRPSMLLSALVGRLVIEWSRDAVNWAKPGPSAAAFRVLEVADPESVPFPGFDRLVLSHSELREIVDDSRFVSWHTALGSVQGVYVIADTSTGKLYVGKADGGERILGRWRDYARTGHGGNVELRALLDLDPNHSRHFQFSILRVFGPSVPGAEILESESHFKRALLTVEFGLNGN